MSEYERQVEEALAKKSREFDSVRKTVQSEQQLISSLNQVFNENSREVYHADDSFPDGVPKKTLEEKLAESSLKKEAAAPKRMDLERELADTSKPKPAIRQPEDTLARELSRVRERQQDEAQHPQESPLEAFQPETERRETGEAAPVSAPEPVREEAFRYRGEPDDRERTPRKGASAVLAALLAVLLTAAAISGGLFYSLFTYQPMADAVNRSSCAVVFENDFLTGLNALAAEEGSGVIFTKDVLVGGQVILDIKDSLRAAYNEGSFEPDCGTLIGQIEAAAAGSPDAAALAAKGGEYYAGMVAAAPDASLFGQTGSLRLILLVILTASVLGSIILLLIISRRKGSGGFVKFSFAGSALLLEVFAVLVMATGIFRRYSAAYTYIAVLSTRYMLGGIVACAAIGVFYMVMAVEAALYSAK